jgi:hypothetical protein
MKKDAKKVLKEKIATAINKVLKTTKSAPSNKTEKTIRKSTKSIVKTIRKKDAIISK